MRKIIIGSLVVMLSILSGCGDETSEFIPEDVILISPVHDEVCELGISYDRNTSRLLFEWERAKNAQLYDLIVTDLETGENYITYTDIATNSKELVLKNEVSYSWQVIARNATTNQVGASDVWNFYFAGEPRINQSPLPANILSPSSSEIVNANNGQVSLSWQGFDPDDDPIKYTVFIDTIDGFQTALGELTDLTETTVEVAVLSGETYYWRIKSDDGAGTSFSQVQSFTVN